jgi:hypothetical protein
MASHSIACPDFSQRNISPDLDRTAMAILRSSHKAGKKNRKLNRSRNWLVESANTQPAPHEYADNTKLGTAFI